MTLDREIIIDLLPAYFSGEASAATCALVEEYFRENPDFEKAARDANRPLEELKVPLSALEAVQEKLAFERARQVRETKNAFLWMAILFSLIMFVFRIQGHKIVFIMWEKGATAGLTFAAIAVFLWVLFFLTRKLKEPLRAHTKFLWLATFYSLLIALFRIKDHRIVWLMFTPEPTVGVLFSLMAAGMWITYFIMRWKANKEG